jgi:hypothetical protein
MKNYTFLWLGAIYFFACGTKTNIEHLRSAEAALKAGEAALDAALMRRLVQTAYIVDYKPNLKPVLEKALEVQTLHKVFFTQINSLRNQLQRDAFEQHQKSMLSIIQSLKSESDVNKIRGIKISDQGLEEFIAELPPLPSDSSLWRNYAQVIANKSMNFIVRHIPNSLDCCPSDYQFTSSSPNRASKKAKHYEIDIFYARRLYRPLHHLQFFLDGQPIGAPLSGIDFQLQPSDTGWQQHRIELQLTAPFSGEISSLAQDFSFYVYPKN